MARKKNMTDVVCDSYFEEIEDDRYLSSGIEDIDNGDNFTEYSKWFYNEYGDDVFHDDCFADGYNERCLELKTLWTL